MQSTLKLTWAAFGLLLTGACATTPPPQAELTKAAGQVTAAEALDAERVPQARLHLELAREQIARAEQLIEDGDNDEARRAITRASADAELARALAVEDTTRREAEEAQTRLDQLRKEAM